MFQLISKYKLHYVIVIPALLLIAVFKIIPFIDEIRLSMVHFMPALGISGSDSAGLDNYARLMHDPQFRKVLTNTVAIKAGYIVLCGFAAFVMALALSAVRPAWLRHSFATLFLIPYVIPSVVFAYLAMLLLSPDHSPIPLTNQLLLGQNETFRPAVIVIETLKTVGIPIVLALAAISWRQARSGEFSLSGSFASRNVIPALRAIVVFMLLQLSTLLSGDFELMFALVNPLVYESGDTLNPYIFRTGFQNGDYGAGAAAGMLQFVVQLLFTVLAYLLVRAWFQKDLFGKDGGDSAGSSSFDGRDLRNAGSLDGKAKIQGAAEAERVGGTAGQAAGIALAGLYALVVLAMLYALFVYPFTSGETFGSTLASLYPAGRYSEYLVLCAAAVVVHLLMTATLAYPLTVAKLPGRGLYKAALLFSLTIGSGTIGEYMLFRDLGMLDTVFPTVVSGFFALADVFVLKSMFNGRHAALKERAEREGRGELYAYFMIFLPNVWKPLLALGVLQLITIWNSFIQSFLYIYNPVKYAPATTFLTLIVEGTADGAPLAPQTMLAFGALLSLPPIVLMLLFRRWLVAGTFLGRIRNL